MTSFIDLYNADEEVWFTGFLKLAVIFNNLEPAWEKTDSESPADSFLGLGLPTASRELLGRRALPTGLSDRDGPKIRQATPDISRSRRWHLKSATESSEFEPTNRS